MKPRQPGNCVPARPRGAGSADYPARRVNVHSSQPAPVYAEQFSQEGFFCFLATGLLGLHLLITLHFRLHGKINCFPERGKVKDI